MLSSSRSKPIPVTSNTLITGKEATENSSRNPIITINSSKTICYLMYPAHKFKNFGYIYETILEL